ncbi:MULTISPECIES: hypothetical protein [Actinoalloteichus]|nr:MULTISPECIES: hypothetical protein [Actinoalloteichus]
MTCSDRHTVIGEAALHLRVGDADGLISFATSSRWRDCRDGTA